MTERELREALLGLESAQGDATSEAHVLTRKILERDRRRVRLLAGLTIVLWTIAAFGIVVALYALLALHPKQGELARAVDRGRVASAEREHIEEVHWAVIQKTTVVVAISVAVLALAALATVFLVFASRGATIRQVNATLLEISEQLKMLKRADRS